MHFVDLELLTVAHLLLHSLPATSTQREDHQTDPPGFHSQFFFVIIAASLKICCNRGGNIEICED